MTSSYHKWLGTVINMARIMVVPSRWIIDLQLMSLITKNPQQGLRQTSESATFQNNNHTPTITVELETEIFDFPNSEKQEKDTCYQHFKGYIEDEQDADV